MKGEANIRQTSYIAYRDAGASIALILVLSLGTILAGCSIPSSGLTTPTNRYALLIGVQDYQTVTPDLKYPDDDATGMKAMLEAQGWTSVTTLINSEATYASIKTHIEALSTDPSATILVYYSGHGSIDEATGTAYILPYDVTWPVDAKWITPATLTNWLAAVPAKHRMLILDSCYSGGFTLGDGSVDTAQADYSQYNYQTWDKTLLLGALSKFGAMVADNLSTYGDHEVLALSASGSEEVSWEDGAVQQGVFTNYLLEAAESGDVDGDGYVTVNEAYAYTKQQIRKNWNIDYAYSFYPDEWDFLPHISGGTGDLVLYDNPGP